MLTSWDLLKWKFMYVSFCKSYHRSLHNERSKLYHEKIYIKKTWDVYVNVWTPIALMENHLSYYTFLSFSHFDGFKCIIYKYEEGNIKLFQESGWKCLRTQEMEERKPSIVRLINSLSFWTLHHAISQEHRNAFICSNFFLNFVAFP